MRGALRSLAAAIAAAVAVAGGQAAAAQAYVFRASIGRAAIARPLPPNFLGLALEYNEIPKLAGATPQSVDPLFVAFLKNLDPDGSPVLRIGGISTDRVWWPVPGMGRPVGVTYNLTPAWTASAAAVAQATGAKYLLGLNLEANRPRIDQVEATQLLAGVGQTNVAGLQIGNEPDLYTLIPWYKTLGGKQVPWYSQQGTPVYARRPQYGPAQFLQEFERTLKVLPSNVPVGGPETGNWLPPFSALLSPGSRVRMLTAHAYGLNNCVTDPALPGYPSVPNLLNAAASRNLLGGLGQYIALAHRDGATFRIDEMGSISCNGRPGVSNSQASALWLMDALFSMDAAGVDGVNLHTYMNSINDLFDFSQVNGQWQASVKPLYYGALMFAQAAPAGSRLLAINSPSQSTMRVWATLGPDHLVRVLVINDSIRKSALAEIRAPAGVGSGPASVERLLAPSVYATDDVTLGGQGYGTMTTTAVLPAAVTQSIGARGRTYGVTLPAGTAALLTLPG